MIIITVPTALIRTCQGKESMKSYGVLCIEQLSATVLPQPSSDKTTTNILNLEYQSTEVKRAKEARTLKRRWCVRVGHRHSSDSLGHVSNTLFFHAHNWKI